VLAPPGLCRWNIEVDEGTFVVPMAGGGRVSRASFIELFGISSRGDFILFPKLAAIEGLVKTAIVLLVLRPSMPSSEI